MKWPLRTDKSSADRDAAPTGGPKASARAGAAWTALFLMTVICTLGVYAAFMYWFDPLNYYHPESHWHAPNRDWGTYQYIAGILKHADYEEVIVGSSLCQNFRVSSIQKKLGWRNPVKCTTGLMFVGDLTDYINIAIATGKAKKIFLGFDLFAFNNEKSAHKDGAQFPSYLFSTNPLNESKYLLNPNLLKNNIALLRAYFSKKPPDPFTLDRDSFWAWDISGTIYPCWPNWENRGMENQMAKQLRELDRTFNAKKQRTDVPSNSFNHKRFDAFVKEVIDAHPDVEFCIFMPPYCVLLWLENPSILDQIIEDRAKIFRRLLSCPNVRVYDQQSDPQIFTNLRHYRDSYHYTVVINEVILDEIASGKNRVTSANISSLNQRMKEAILNFNPRPWVEGLDRANMQK